jgi:Uma2 family endonuclease
MSGLFTRADYDLLPEGFPAQLVQGSLVKEPAPTYEHQRLVGRLRDVLVPIVGPDLVVVAPADVVLDERNVFQPDVVVLHRMPPPESRNVGIPRIAFEVLSPTSAERDRDVKRRALLAAGVEEVWLLDPRDRSIEVWSRDGMRRSAGPTPAISTALPALRAVPARLFASPTG